MPIPDTYHDKKTNKSVHISSNESSPGPTRHTPVMEDQEPKKDDIWLQVACTGDEKDHKEEFLKKNGQYFTLESYKRAPWMEIAKNEIGIEEIYGIKNNNPRILEYHEAAGYNKKLMGREITDDWIGNIRDAWCGSFVYWCLWKSGIKKEDLNKKGYNAFSWKNWGKKVDKPAYGAIAILSYSHIAFVAGKKGDEIILLGGNQTGGDENTYGKVCYSAAKKS